MGHFWCTNFWVPDSPLLSCNVSLPHTIATMRQVIGVIMLWVGWYGFNCGSVASIVGKSPVVGRVAINTTVAAIVGALTASIVCYFHVGIFVIDKVLMGILAGLVSVTAGAPYFWAPAAAAIGFVGFFVYYVVDLALVKFEIDDPVSAFPVHGCCGLWGLIAVGFFQIPALSEAPKPYFIQLLCQLLGVPLRRQGQTEEVGAVGVWGWAEFCLTTQHLREGGAWGGLTPPTHPHGPPPPPRISDWANFSPGLQPIKNFLWCLWRKSV